MTAELRDALFAYTLTHPGTAFVHQHVVDALTAQMADRSTPTRPLVYALVGLYLHVEHHASGRHVQRVHATLARQPLELPTIALPEARGAVTGAEVLAARAGPDRDAQITAWCASVWAAYAAARPAITALLTRARIT